MLPASFLNKLLVLLPVTHPYKGSTNDVENSGSWNYNNPNKEWGRVNEQCDGSRQSGIALSSTTSIIAPILPLKFSNYDVPLVTPLTISNDDKTVNINLPETQNGYRASITGGLLRDRFEAVNLHFHWGDNGVKGSEHSIDGRRFDLELHIVHKNERYDTIEEAVQYKDGLAVLGVMLKIADDPDRFYPGLNKIYDKLPSVTNSADSTRLDGAITVGQLLGDVNTKRFFTYSGSLTTPPCSEAVTWHVFPDPLVITRQQAQRFFGLFNKDNRPLVNNYRPLQATNRRPVYYRVPFSSMKVLDDVFG